MTKEEILKFVEEDKNKKHLLLSPRMIQGKGPLFQNYEDIIQYENMDSNTTKLVFSLSTDLMIKSRHSDDSEVSDYLNLYLIFEGDFEDLTAGNDPCEIIMQCKDKITAIYRYVKNTTERNFFVGMPFTEKINNYGYVYINFANLLEEFEKNGVTINIDLEQDKYTRSMYRDETVTKFKISYVPKKEIDNPNTPVLKKK